ncbi:MAG: DUF4280 domain-containing protein [Rhodospirillales bacterium]|nr:DUF4280 domain-containing protein [Rhodospirillales bacterium]MDE2576336.1 DUF4280 domain-containing protein [Rhodospirillales bacterium]
MPQQVVNTAQIACSFCPTPGVLTVLPVNRVQVGSQPAANVMDHVATVNIPPFGPCMSPSNPQVIAATTAALGVFTPQPCLPVTPAPWVPGAVTVPLANQPALDNAATLTCAWGGVISVVMPGQVTTSVP